MPTLGLCQGRGSWAGPTASASAAPGHTSGDSSRAGQLLHWNRNSLRHLAPPTSPQITSPPALPVSLLTFPGINEGLCNLGLYVQGKLAEHREQSWQMMIARQKHWKLERDFDTTKALKYSISNEWMNQQTPFITAFPPWYLDKASKQTPRSKHPDFFKDWSPMNLLQ